KERVSLLKTELEKRLAESTKQSAELMGQKQVLSGPRYYIVVDDYEGVATPAPQNGNPLNPLDGLLGSGTEIGLHLILARRVVELNRTNFDPIFRGVRNMESPGLLMRGDTIEGRQALHRQNISDALPTGRACYVARNTPPAMLQIARIDG